MLKTITSESVNIGHPDKTCDYIADAFLDEALAQDPNSQMAVECAIKNDKLFIYGEATTNANINYEKIARGILKDIGYKNNFTIIQEISSQSKDIHNAVIREQLCANDQGVVFGYAVAESEEYMPLPITIAHKLMKKYEEYRRKTQVFLPDAKSQVSIVYDNNKPCFISTILISVSHEENVDNEFINIHIKRNVINVVLDEYKHLVNGNTQFLINPSGRFTIWGSFGDSGCVGRKIVVDTYGGVGKVGGGCFSSKNATKIDRSAAYYARYVAKNIVAKGFAYECEIQLSYAIGLPNPISIYVNCFNSNKVSMEIINKYVTDNFSFAIKDIINELDLTKPIYKQTACYGHFGRQEFTWERIK